MELANERFTSPVKVCNTWGKQSLITNNGILLYERTVLKKESYPSDGSFVGFKERMISVWFISSVNGSHESNNIFYPNSKLFLHSAVCCFGIEFYMYSTTIVNNRHGRDYSTLDIHMVIL